MIWNQYHTKNDIIIQIFSPHILTHKINLCEIDNNLSMNPQNKIKTPKMFKILNNNSKQIISFKDKLEKDIVLRVYIPLPSALISIDFLPIHEFKHVLFTALLGPAFTSCSFSAQVSFWWTQSDKSRMAVILVSSIIMNDLAKITKYNEFFWAPFNSLSLTIKGLQTSYSP